MYSDDAAAAPILDEESVMQAMERVPRTSRDRIRYTRERLFEFHDACTQLPEVLKLEGLTVRKQDPKLESPKLEGLTVSKQELRLREGIGKTRRKNNRDRSDSPAQALTSPAIEKTSDALTALAIEKTANVWMDQGSAQLEKEVYRTVKGILNNLTPEKLDVLEEQMMQAGISSAEILQGVVSLIFDKAMLEPVLCAKLCVRLSKQLPEFPGEQAGDKPVTFRGLLLNTCQEVFEGADAMREEIEKLTKPEQAAERDEMVKRVKLRTLGNITLIGELFKQKMLSKKIVHECIQELLWQNPKANPAEENVEALCHLITSVRKQLEVSAKAKMAFDMYFVRLKVIGESKALPSRIRLMVRDILDMRSKRWAQRQAEMKVKAINEIHAEAEAKLGLRPGMMAL